MQQVLKVSRKIDYALRAMIHLAGLPHGRLVSHKELADRLSLPKDFTAKIMKTLSERGLVSSVRGPHGGFKLAKSPQCISMLDVIEATEGPVSLNVCLDSKSSCAVSESCTMYDVWRVGQEKMLDVYRTATLASLAEQREVLVPLEIRTAASRPARPSRALRV